MFIAKHGPWNRTQKYNGVYVAWPDGKGGAKVELLMTGFVENNTYLGRPVDFPVMKDGSLLVSDDQTGASQDGATAEVRSWQRCPFAAVRAAVQVDVESPLEQPCPADALWPGLNRLDLEWVGSGCLVGLLRRRSSLRLSAHSGWRTQSSRGAAPRSAAPSARREGQMRCGTSRPRSAAAAVCAPPRRRHPARRGLGDCMGPHRRRSQYPAELTRPSTSGRGQLAASDPLAPGRLMAELTQMR